MTREIPPFRRASDRWITIFMLGMALFVSLVAVRQFLIPNLIWVPYVYLAAAMFFIAPAVGMVTNWMRYARHARARTRDAVHPCLTCGHPQHMHADRLGACELCMCSSFPLRGPS